MVDPLAMSEIWCGARGEDQARCQSFHTGS